MWGSVLNWLYTNAAAIFISAIASLLISKFYFDKANRDGVISTIIFPVVKILEKRSYSRKNYEELFIINFIHIRRLTANRTQIEGLGNLYSIR